MRGGGQGRSPTGPAREIRRQADRRPQEEHPMRKTKLTTTFNLLRKHNACPEGYRKLARHLDSVDTYGVDVSINLLVILESNGIDDMLWCLRATEQNCDRVARHLAADFAE